MIQDGVLVESAEAKPAPPSVAAARDSNASEGIAVAKEVKAGWAMREE